MNLPNTFEEKMKHLLGEEYEDYLKCYEEPRHYGLRVNTNKISVEDFLKIAPWPLRPVPWISNGFYYDGDQIQPSNIRRASSTSLLTPSFSIRLARCTCTVFGDRPSSAAISLTAIPCASFSAT